MNKTKYVAFVEKNGTLIPREKGRPMRGATVKTVEVPKAWTAKTWNGVFDDSMKVLTPNT
jgi:hypothetical protein